MKKMIVFDMDGTIANLYGVENWLEKLRAEDVSPYVEAEPLWDMQVLGYILTLLQEKGYIIAVTSWLGMKATKEYKHQTAQAKREWLDRYNFPYNELHFVQYGTTKANCTRHKADFQILIDDNDKVRAGWSLGATINPMTENIIDVLGALYLAE